MTRAATTPRQALRAGALLMTLACVAACRGGGGARPPHARSTVVPRFAYVANEGDDTVSVYTVDAATGQLRHHGYARAGAAPHAVAVDPAGRFAYVANAGSNDLSIYGLDAATGALVRTGTTAAGNAPAAITPTATVR